MIKVILFDLDGTLLPMDTNHFVKNYLKQLGPRVAHIIDPNVFLQALWAGTDAMVQNVDDQKTNEEVFEETFLQLLKLKKEEIWPVLDDFYTTVFPTLSFLASPTSIAREIVETAIEDGYRVAVATNPLFPKVAIDERLKWAGVEDLPFEFVTVYENSYFTKPHQQYYKFICEKLNVDPKECVMIGNDKQEDMAAAQIGMKTFLVEDYLIDRGEPNFPIDDQGTLVELLEKIKAKQGLWKKEIVE